MIRSSNKEGIVYFYSAIVFFIACKKLCCIFSLRLAFLNWLIGLRRQQHTPVASHLSYKLNVTIYVENYNDYRESNKEDIAKKRRREKRQESRDRKRKSERKKPDSIEEEMEQGQGKGKGKGMER